MSSDEFSRSPSLSISEASLCDTLFPLLDGIPFGAYAVSIDQVILHWNVAAERILGYESADVTGRRCYEVMSGHSDRGLAPECSSGCPSIRHLRAGLIPSPIRLQMACLSGQRKWVTLAPVVLGGIFWDASVIVHLFDDESTGPELAETRDLLRDAVKPDAEARQHIRTSPHPLTEPPEISPRELEVLRLVALGWDSPRIAVELGISPHTVRNHVRNFRNKLNAATKLEAVMAAIRLGILDVDVRQEPSA